MLTKVTTFGNMSYPHMYLCSYPNALYVSVLFTLFILMLQVEYYQVGNTVHFHPLNRFRSDHWQ